MRRYVIWGPPGTGKTEDLSRQTAGIVKWARDSGLPSRRPVLIASLTRTAASEIAGRVEIPRDCVGTLHSHAYRALGAPEVAESNVKDFNHQHPEYRLSVADADVDEPDWDRQGQTPGDTLSAAYHVLRARMTPEERWPLQVRGFAEVWREWKNDADVVDFTDMISQAIQTGEFDTGAQAVLADEAQDNSRLEYELLKKMGGAAGRLIIAGDPDQCLYDWRGADPDIFLDPNVPAEQRRVLSQSWRVPRRIHAVGMAWRQQLSNVQPLEYQPRDEEGEAAAVGITWKQPGKLVDLAEQYLDQGKSVMIAASCGFLLRLPIQTLRKRGVPFCNPWRRKRGDWNPLGGGKGVRMPQRIRDFALDEVWGERLWTNLELAHWADILSAKGVLRRGAKRRVKWLGGEQPQEEVTAEMLADSFTESAWNELVNATYQEEGATDKQRLRRMLDWLEARLLKSKAKAASYPLTVARQRGVSALAGEPKLYIGTIHSFKGSQADVVILLPDVSPSGFRCWFRGGRLRDGVVRQFYVGITRARETLIACAPASNIAVNLKKYVKEAKDR